MLCGTRVAVIFQSQHLYGSLSLPGQCCGRMRGFTLSEVTNFWFGHHPSMDRKQWFTSQENGLEEFNHFIVLKQNVWHTTERSLLSVCHLTWINKGDIFIPMDQGMLVTALTVEKMKMVYVCDKPFRDRLETSLSMRCNLKQYQGLNLHCYKL